MSPEMETAAIWQDWLKQILPRKAIPQILISVITDGPDTGIPILCEAPGEMDVPLILRSLASLYEANTKGSEEEEVKKDIRSAGEILTEQMLQQRAIPTVLIGVTEENRVAWVGAPLEVQDIQSKIAMIKMVLVDLEKQAALRPQAGKEGVN
jgi:hypothetical protein